MNIFRTKMCLVKFEGNDNIYPYLYSTIKQCNKEWHKKYTIICEYV